MKTWVQRAGLLAGLALAVMLLQAGAVGQDQTPAGKQDTAGAPRGQRVFFAAHREGGPL